MRHLASNLSPRGGGLDEDDDVVLGDIDGVNSSAIMRNASSTPKADNPAQPRASSTRQTVVVNDHHQVHEPEASDEVAAAAIDCSVRSGEVPGGILRGSAAKPPIKPKTFKKKTTKGEVFKVTIMEDTRPEKKSKVIRLQAPVSFILICIFKVIFNSSSIDTWKKKKTLWQVKRRPWCY